MRSRPTAGRRPSRRTRLIDTWLYGEHLHYDLAKADKIEEHEGITEMLRFSLESAIRDFTDFYGKMATLAAAVVDTPELASRH